MTAFLGIRGFMGKPASLGIDATLAVYSEDADWFDIVAWNRARKAFEELRNYNGKIVILIHSMGWHWAVKGIREYLQGKDVYLITLDPAKVGIPPWTPVYTALVSPLSDSRHLNIWQTNNFPQDFGPVKGAENVKWHEAGHEELDDRPGVQKLVREKIDAFLQEEKPVTDYKITPRIALEIAAHEGLVQEAYKDSVGVWTWSIGVTDYSGHKVRRYIDNPADIDRCIEVYIWLLDTKYMPAVERAFQGRDLTEEQIAAALSFHWNTGSIEKASWVRYWLAGDIEKAKAKFMAWRIPPEIIPRREKELKLFFNGKWSGNGTVNHYPLVGSGGKLNTTQVKKLDITQAVTEAIEAHYAPAVPVPVNPPETLPEPPVDDIEAIEAHIREHIPNVDQTALHLYLIHRLMRGDPPPIEGETIAPTYPSTEAGFFIPEKENENMAFTGTKSLLKSKTIWGLGAAAISIFVPQLAPIVDILAPSAADVPPEAVNASKEAIQAIVTSIQNIIASASLLYAAWGRKVATDRIE